MPIIVQKYGGTSLDRPEKILSVARRIQRLKERGNSVLVVVSAMGHTTDQLLDLAHQVSDRPHGRELDMLLTAGERISMALLAMALNDLGVPAVSLTGSQSGIITSEHHGQAMIQEIRPSRIEEGLKDGKVVLVAGFQGVSLSREVTTLGRGGSDTTAVALAARFKANRCEILTDVNGVFTADPRTHEKARHISQCSSWQLYKMASLGAKVMHPRAAYLAWHYRVPLWVGHSEQELKGTEVIPTMETNIIPSVSGFSDVVLVSYRIPASKIESWRTAMNELTKRFSLRPLFNWQTYDSTVVAIDHVFVESEFKAAQDELQRRMTALEVGLTKEAGGIVTVLSVETCVQPLSAFVSWLEQHHVPVRKAFTASTETYFLVKKEQFIRAQQVLEQFSSSSQSTQKVKTVHVE